MVWSGSVSNSAHSRQRTTKRWDQSTQFRVMFTYFLESGRRHTKVHIPFLKTSIRGPNIRSASCKPWRDHDSRHFLKTDLVNNTLSPQLLSFQVILVNVVHLRDTVCPLPTSILAQYLKQASGQLSCLKVRKHPQKGIRGHKRQLLQLLCPASRSLNVSRSL